MVLEERDELFLVSNRRREMAPNAGYIPTPKLVV